MVKSKYDIFISYRREGGAQYARILQLMLIQRGYRVFLDYDELTDGIFSDKIRKAIKEAPIFMIVLSKGSMTRCANDGDWLREEIKLAIELGKHIVPINPDNSFDGFPNGMPKSLRGAIDQHQHSEIIFGQVLGATIDLMIKNRLEPTLGKHIPQGDIDNHLSATQATSKNNDSKDLFKNRISITYILVTIAIILGTCFWLIKENKENEYLMQKEEHTARIRKEIQEKHKNLLLQFNSDLTVQQMKAVDTMLTNISVVYPDSIWMSQYEFSTGLWHSIKGEPFEEAERDYPKTNVTYWEIYQFLIELGDMTNLIIELPGADIWEYAAKGGNYNETTRYSGNDDIEKAAWYEGNSGGKIHPSNGQQGLEPNMLDLYDMSGNVSEICNTSFNNNGLYTICGGDYDSPASEVTIGSRKGFAIDAKDKHVGFRIIIRKL